MELFDCEVYELALWSQEAPLEDDPVGEFNPETASLWVVRLTLFG